MSEPEEAPRGKDVITGVDRIVPPTDKFAGMTVIVRGGHEFACVGVGPEVDAHLESAAIQRLAVAADRAADPDRVNFCRGHRDGDCFWEGCPQLREHEPARSGRHCPLDEGCPRCLRTIEECTC